MNMQVFLKGSCGGSVRKKKWLKESELGAETPQEIVAIIRGKGDGGLGKATEGWREVGGLEQLDG